MGSTAGPTIDTALCQWLTEVTSSSFYSIPREGGTLGCEQIIRPDSNNDLVYSHIFITIID